MKELRLGILGATGAVGREMLKLLDEYRVPVSELRLLSGGKSAGALIPFRGQAVAVKSAEEGSFQGLDYVLGAAEAEVSRHFVPFIRSSGACYIDNSSAFRLDLEVPLVVPEINGLDAFTH